MRSDLTYGKPILHVRFRILDSEKSMVGQFYKNFLIPKNIAELSRYIESSKINL